MSRVRWLNITILSVLVALSMVFAVACGGSSATQIASPIERAVPTAAAVPTAVPTEAAAMPAATEAAEATTAAPVPTGKMGSFPETPFPLLKAPEDNPKRGGVLRYAFYVSGCPILTSTKPPAGSTRSYRAQCMTTYYGYTLLARLER